MKFISRFRIIFFFQFQKKMLLNFNFSPFIYIFRNFIFEKRICHRKPFLLSVSLKAKENIHEINSVNEKGNRL